MNRSHTIGLLILLALLGAVPVAAQPQPTATPSTESIQSTPTPALELLPYESGKLEPQQAQSYLEEARKNQAAEEAKERPDSAQLGFYRRSSKLFTDILELYQNEASYPDRKQAADQSLEEAQAQRKALEEELSVEVEPTTTADSGAQELERTIALLTSTRLLIASLEKERLELESTAKRRVLELDAANRERSETEDVRDQYEKALVWARTSKQSAAESLQLEQRYRIRTLGLAYYERQLRLLEREQDLLGARREVLQLRLDTERTRLQRLEARRETYSRHLHQGLQDETIDATSELEQARLRAQQAQPAFDQLLAQQQVELKQHEVSQIDFHAKAIQSIEPATALLLDMQGIVSEHDLAQLLVQQFIEEKHLGTVATLRQNQLSEQLRQLDSRQQTLAKALSEQLSGLRNLAEEADHRRTELRTQLRNLGTSFQRLTTQAHEQFLAQPNLTPSSAERRWKQEAAKWQSLQTEARTSLEKQQAALNSLLDGQLLRLILDLESQQERLDAIEKFIEAHHPSMRIPNRIDLLALAQVSEDVLTGFRSAAQLVGEVPGQMRSWLLDGRVISTVLILFVAIVGGPFLLRRLMPSIPETKSLRPRLRKAISHIWIGSLLALAVHLLPFRPTPRKAALILLAAFVGFRVLGLWLAWLERTALFPLPARTHVAQRVRALARWSLAWVPCLVLLQTVEYANLGILDLLWTTYWSGMVVLLGRLLWPKTLLLSLLGEKRAAAWPWRAFFTLLLPVLLLLAVGILIVWLRGYHAYAWDLLLYTTSSLFVLALAFVSLFVLFHLLCRFVRDRPTSSEPSRLGWLRTFEILQVLLVAGIALATVITIAAAWQIAPDQLSELADTPLPWVDPEATNPLSYGELFQFLMTLGLTVLLARYVRAILRETWIPSFQIEPGLGYAISVLAGYAIVLLGLILAFSLIHVSTAQLQWLVAFVGIGLGFGLQDIVTNFVAGIILLFERPVKVGDIVTIGTYEGRVETINIRSTTVRTRTNLDVLIPNKRLITEEVVNWTHVDNLVWTQIRIGVAYDSDVKVVREILLDVANKHGRVLQKPEPVVRLMEFSPSSLDFVLQFCITEPMSRVQIESDLRFALRAAFSRAGIEIPYPQQELRIRPGNPEAATLLTASTPAPRNLQTPPPNALP